MATVKRTYRLQVMLNAKELAIIDGWRFEKRVPTLSEAVRQLLQLGQAATETDHDSVRRSRSSDFGILDPSVD